MAEPARKRATYQELEAVPNRFVAEIIGGELRTTPRPAPRHTRVASRLGARLDRAFDEGEGGPGGWWILDEPEVHLPSREPGLEEIVVPDIAGWRVERMPDLPATAYFALAPDWVCEVLSPSTEADDRSDKMPIYGAAGVKHAWLVDPIVKTVEVYRLHEGNWLLLATYKGDATMQAEPFHELTLPLAALWAPPAHRR